MNRKTFKEQTSSGGVIFRSGPDGISVALIRKSTRSRKPLWCLPKGWMEPGETLESAALREVQEETGLDGKILEKLGVISYRFYDKESKSRVHKTVHFYLMEYVSGDTSNHDHEVEEVGWFSLEEVENLLTYPTEREIFKKALHILKG